jgi:hypothetical protein
MILKIATYCVKPILNDQNESIGCLTIFETTSMDVLSDELFPKYLHPVNSFKKVCVNDGEHDECGMPSFNPQWYKHKSIEQGDVVPLSETMLKLIESIKAHAPEGLQFTLNFKVDNVDGYISMMNAWHL